MMSCDEKVRGLGARGGGEVVQEGFPGEVAFARSLRHESVYAGWGVGGGTCSREERSVWVLWRREGGMDLGRRGGLYLGEESGDP